ncbi:unnamed protein product [Brachionus calyciflorus]|uniref:DOMON domain-containing protein n=1 Tax=Brachionus calyciflorus TaxID=104777 RepID=A0A813RXU2_9BILA|nr:unnamed protein product [Brachionus calyciflorus]
MKFLKFITFLGVIGLFEALNYKYSTILDHDNKVRLEWNIEEFKTEKYINFRLLVKTDQLPLIIGFGASDRGGFINADLIVFDVRIDQIFYIDSYTNSKGLLKRDKIQNYFNISKKIIKFEPQIEIELKFERKLDTCDPKDYLIETGTVHLVHFLLKNNKLYPNLKSLYSNSFYPEKDADSFDMKQTQLVKSTFFDDFTKKFNEKETRFFDMRNTKVQLPNLETTYWCKVFKLEEKFINKHHIVAYESLISETSKGIVHHMELFHCITDPSEDMKSYNGPCKSEEKPPGLTQCRKVVAAWAMGAGRFVYPDDVGGVIGGKDYSPYVVLEIHFDNPKMRSDIIDSSGMRIFYIGGPNEKLRTYDAGIMEVGLEYNSKNSIPPQSLSFHHHGYCLGTCTKYSLPKKGVTIFASQLHTHLTGRKVWTSLVRNGKVIQIINSDNHYDQMFQEIRLLQRPVRVKPGDTIINTCVFETMDRENMTFGGYSIRDEMCVNYMHYYPISNLEVCKSSIYDKVLDNFFAKMNFYDSAETKSNNSIQKNFNSIRWTKLTSSILSKLYDKSPISFSCNSSDGEHIQNVYGKNDEKEFFEIPTFRNLKSTNAPLDPNISSQCRRAHDDDEEYNYDEDLSSYDYESEDA